MYVVEMQNLNRKLRGRETELWAEKAEKLMGDKKYYDRVMKKPSTKRKAEYLKIVKNHTDRLDKIKPPKGKHVTKFKEPKTYTIKHVRPHEIFVGYEGTSLRCIEDCDVE